MPDPDLEMRGGGGVVGGSSLPKTFFQPFGPQFCPKIKGVPSVDPPLRSVSEFYYI